MKFKIDGCTGCGFCGICWPEWFYCDSAGRGHARDVEIPVERMREVNNCIEQCCGRAISLVEVENG